MGIKCPVKNDIDNQLAEKVITIADGWSWQRRSNHK